MLHDYEIKVSNFNNETKKITINEDEANIVRYMFERYGEGVGSSTIAKN